MRPMHFAIILENSVFCYIFERNCNLCYRTQFLFLLLESDCMDISLLGFMFSIMDDRRNSRFLTFHSKK